MEINKIKNQYVKFEDYPKQYKILQFALDRAPEAIFLIAPDAHFVYINDQACRSLEYSRRELLSMAVYDIDPIFTKKVWPKHWKELKKRRCFTIESIHRKKSGNTFPVEISINYLKFAGREYNCAFARDITVRKEAEEALRESEAKYRTLIEAANDAIFLADAKSGCIIDANKQAGKLLGLSRREIVGKHQTELHPKGEAQYYNHIFRGHIRQKRGQQISAFVEHADGRKIPVHISSRVIELRGRKVIMGIFRDITELKEIEEALKRDKAGLKRLIGERTEELEKIQKEFENTRRLSEIGVLAASVAHELRNPLGVIKTACYNIRRKRKNRELDSHLEHIEKKIYESDRFIKSLLDYARIKLPHYQRVPVLKVLEECLVQTRAKHNGWNVRINIKHNLPRNAAIEADPLQMAQLCSNLMDNAYQAFPDKKGTISVNIDYQRRLNRLKVLFRDNGVGIDRDDLPRIFDPFFTRRARGTGLGLAVCSQVVDLHGGKIEIASTRGKGTTVLVNLPIKQRN
jgi:PAS domain S-box-containing protein